MTLPWILLYAALAAAAWHVVASLWIHAWLDRRNAAPSILLLRLYAPKCAGDYARRTTAETGRIGPLFWHWVVSINAALVLSVVAMILMWA